MQRGDNSHTEATKASVLLPPSFPSLVSSFPLCFPFPFFISIEARVMRTCEVNTRTDVSIGKAEPGILFEQVTRRISLISGSP